MAMFELLSMNLSLQACAISQAARLDAEATETLARLRCRRRG